MIAYWLVPAEPERNWLSSCIAALAREHNAPVFEPHLTLYVVDDDETLAAARVTRAALNGQPITVAIEAIDFSAGFTKSLFVRLVRTPRLERLAELLQDQSRGEDVYDLNPHVSLLYADISADEKSAAALRVQLPFDSLTFESMQAVVFTPPIKTRADVEAWRTLTKTKLGG